MNSELYNIQFKENLENSIEKNINIIDEGEVFAKASLISGILSLFCFPSSVASLVFASKYKKTGNGENLKKIKTGKILSIISLIFKIFFLIAGVSFALLLKNYY